MTRASEPTPQRIIAAAYECFYREGFYRTSVDAVAARAKVTKKTLYYHFPSKDALVGAVLDKQADHAITLVESSLASQETDPGKAVRNIFQNLGRWASRPHWHGSGFTRIAMELAELPGHPARVATARHKRQVEMLLAKLLSDGGIPDAEATARQIAMLVEGAMVLILIHGDPDYASDAADAAQALVRQATQAG